MIFAERCELTGQIFFTVFSLSFVAEFLNSIENIKINQGHFHRINQNIQSHEA